MIIQRATSQYTLCNILVLIPVYTAMGCCLSKMTKNYYATAMAANTMGNLIGMMGKYSPKHMNRSTYPGPTFEQLEEGLDLMAGKMTDLNEQAQAIVRSTNDKGENESKIRFYQLEQFHVRGQLTTMSHNDKFAIPNGEKKLTALINTYNVQQDTVVFKKTGGETKLVPQWLFLVPVVFSIRLSC